MATRFLSPGGSHVLHAKVSPADPFDLTCGTLYSVGWANIHGGVVNAGIAFMSIAGVDWGFAIQNDLRSMPYLGLGGDVGNKTDRQPF